VEGTGVVCHTLKLKEATTSLRGLDLAKFEELVAVAPAAAASALYGYKGTTPKKMFTKDAPRWSSCKDCNLIKRNDSMTNDHQRPKMKFFWCELHFYLRF